MTIRFELPPEIERNLRREFADLDEAVKETAMVELYRQEKLTQHEFSLSLGLTRLETEAVLHKHHVTEDLPTREEYDAALARLREMTAQ